jgi:hypothetical protein
MIRALRQNVYQYLEAIKTPSSVQLRTSHTRERLTRHDLDTVDNLHDAKSDQEMVQIVGCNEDGLTLWHRFRPQSEVLVPVLAST